MASKTQKRSTQGQSELPEFDAPPLFETVLGVRFPRLSKWDIPHFGLYWDSIRSDYPSFEVQQPLPPPGVKPGLGSGISLQLATLPVVRCWFLAPGQNRLIQVQHDGFFHNWRKLSLDEVYPRYAKTIRPAFSAEWERFRGFLSAEEIEMPEVVECEVAYVNHFEKGREWTSAGDLGSLLPWWAGAPEQGPSPTAVRIDTRFQVGENTLAVNLVPVIRRQDGLEILQFTLTVNGRPDSSETSDVMNWMDGARATIVQKFTDLTSEAMHRLWKRTS